jgi:hypothetical protein
MDQDPQYVPVARVGGSGRGPLGAIVVVILVVAVAIWKPWVEPAPAPAGVGAPRPSPSSLAPRATFAPSVTPGSHPDAAICYGLGSWRVVVVEDSPGRQVRTWIALEPIVTADGPTDPSIPIARVVSGGVEAAGFCGRTLRDRAGGRGEPSLLSAWWLGEGRGHGRLQVERVEPVADGTAVLWALKADPEAPDRAWPVGRYVFEVGDPRPQRGGATSEWFGIDIVEPPAPPSSPDVGQPSRP